MGRELTANEREFCAQVAAGVAPAAAYRKAFDVKGMNPNTLRSNATRLQRREYIVAECDRLRGMVQTQDERLELMHTAGALRSREWLAQQAEAIITGEDERTSDRLAAIRVYCELAGYKTPAVAVQQSNTQVVEVSARDVLSAIAPPPLG